MTTKKYETIKVEKEDGITFVIFNRPDKRNAMSPQLHLDMDDALDDLATDEETQVLVITGAGEAFCAGQDIKLYFRGTETEHRVVGRDGEVAGAHLGEAAAEAEAVDHGDGRHREGGELLPAPLVGGAARLVPHLGVGLGAAEIQLDVLAGAEGLAGAGDDQHLGLLIGRQIVER